MRRSEAIIVFSGTRLPLSEPVFQTAAIGYSADKLRALLQSMFFYRPGAQRLPRRHAHRRQPEGAAGQPVVEGQLLQDHDVPSNPVAIVEFFH